MKPGEIMLVQGPPGSGKTRMIAQMAKEIFSEQYLLSSHKIDESKYNLPKPVLILANTHRAADEVVTKLASFDELKPFIVRLESYSKDHPDEVKEFIIPNRTNFDEAFKEKADADLLVSILKQGINHYKQSGIIVGTLGSVGNNLLKGIEFQWVIIDEAGQATEPATLGAFRHLCPESESSERYPRIVLVGDHKQLPPVVAEETIELTPAVPDILRKAGLNENDSLKTSLFERLFRLWQGKHNNVMILSEQYRMNEAVSRIIKNAFYQGVNYVPANDEIGSHTLDEYFKELGIDFASFESNNFIANLFEPKVPVVFINTEKDSLATEGIQEVDIQTESRFNIRESQIIGSFVADFIKLIDENKREEIAQQIGIISPYRHQNNLIYSELRSRGISEEVINQIRVDTVDRFQGDEREIIIISLTNSNDSNIIGQLHRDWRRMNVSISRAKAKLIVIGNRQTFTKKSTEEKEEEAKKLFKEVFKTIEELKKEGLAQEINSTTIKL
jgi:superfamily I DNA and/or RNA helicase